MPLSLRPACPAFGRRLVLTVYELPKALDDAALGLLLFEGVDGLTDV